MIKSELAKRLAVRHSPPAEDADRFVAAMLDTIEAYLVLAPRVEIRRSGSFSEKQKPARMGRSPRTGAPALVNEQRRPHFSDRVEMRERLNGP
jgi:integration host factor subunit beta